MLLGVVVAVELIVHLSKHGEEYQIRSTDTNDGKHEHLEAC